MGYLAIDFGGTQTRAAWLDDSMQLIQRRITASNVHEPIDQVVQRMIDLARSVIPPDAKPTAIGIAAPGPLDAQQGIILHAETLPGWHNIPLAQRISKAFDGRAAFMNNDANLGALAESKMGAGKDANPMIYLTLSTGIGGGAVIDGKLFMGWRGLAIEPGHMRLMTGDGQIKRLEELASGTAIGARAAARLLDTTEPSQLRKAVVVDGEAVGIAAQQGDALALEIVHEMGIYLGMGLVNLLHLFNPQAIVIGGSVAQLGELILQPARQIIHQHMLSPDFMAPDLIRLARLQDSVCLYGAALYAQEQMREAL